MAKVALILSGCGYLDGSEIHESVLSLLALDEAGHRVTCFAPDSKQVKVVDHLTQKEQKSEVRSILCESARIARGDIHPLKTLNSKEFDALMMPGGYGAVLNLCTYATEGEGCHVERELQRHIVEFYRQKKPILATCISPLILACALRDEVSLTMTLGSDPENQKLLAQFGMRGELKEADEACFDERHLIYTTPCYMEKASLSALYRGIKKIVGRL